MARSECILVGRHYVVSTGLGRRDGICPKPENIMEWHKAVLSSNICKIEFLISSVVREKK